VAHPGSRRDRAVRIITLEDPIDYILPNDRALVSHRQVGLHVGSFAGGLRSGLREDPDIIFVGEMRDRETAGLALTAAETGSWFFRPSTPRIPRAPFPE